MESELPGRRVAIIGLGPRGLGAAEALAAKAIEAGQSFVLECFDAGPAPGAGPNFSPDQTGICLLNTPLRDIDIAPPDALAETTVALARHVDPGARDPDQFPSRAAFGAYLVDRFDSLAARAAPALRLRCHRASIDALERQGGGWRLRSGDAWRGPFDEVLLTLGQPGEKTSPQIARWRDHAARCGAELLPAYPDTRLLKAAQGWAGRAVGIRGLGLSTFDILRVLTIGLGGRFEQGRYAPSGREPARIVPFSLNGRPPAPKPASGDIDALFDPTSGETRSFVIALERAVRSSAGSALDPIFEALLPAASRILREADAGVAESAIRDWLEREREAPDSQDALPPRTLLGQEIAMAEGVVAPSIGFVVGQLWRKWQNDLRRGFNPADISAETAQTLIDFDEGLKRYSYGPPVESARQLATLVDQGLVRLCVADDPDIALTERGWRLMDGKDAVHVSAMVDGVMASPSLDGVESALIEDLKRAGRLSAVAEGLGARTQADGQLIGEDGAAQPGLSLLGRLALGSVIAVDSIHDCFGAAATRWADGVIRRTAAAVAA